ncbi:hypothetical protein [Solibacillus daqui]|uniref:hypothetical protein n=1 Tax=Solibacillus daqui TaxID=2912187 RepID=UPI0023665E24|nr:hypothetical protein [Solibacillus daqui]
MDKLTKKDVQRGIDTVIGKRVLFTPDLRKKIRSEAKTRSKKQRFPIQWIPSAIIGIALIGIALFFILTSATPTEAPNVTTENPVQEINLVNDLSQSYYGLGNGTNGSTFEDGALALQVVEKTLKFLTAYSTGDFATTKQFLHSEATLDEQNETIIFRHDGEFSFEKAFFQPFSATDLELLTISLTEQDNIFMIFRIDHHSYEIMLSKDLNANDEYRISQILGNS